MKRRICMFGMIGVLMLAGCTSGETAPETVGSETIESATAESQVAESSDAEEAVNQEQGGSEESSDAVQTDSVPEIWMHANVPQYRGLAYQTYKAMTGLEAEHFHGDFYTAFIEKANLTAVFKATDFNPELGVSALTDEDVAVRLEGSLSTIFAGSYDVMSIDTFIEMLSWPGGTEIDYRMEEGAGTAYYIADKYLVVHFDSDGDGMNDAVLDVALDDMEQIGPDSTVWLYLDDSQY